MNNKTLPISMALMFLATNCCPPVRPIEKVNFNLICIVLMAYLTRRFLAGNDLPRITTYYHELPRFDIALPRLCTAYTY